MKLILVAFILLLLMGPVYSQQTAEDWVKKGIDLDDQGNYVDAIKAYDEAIKLDPNDVVAWINKGNALFMQDKYDEAIKNYDEAIRIDPNNVKPWLNKGNTFGLLNRYDEAIDAYNEAIKINPKYAKAWFNKGHTLRVQGNYPEAIKAYDEAIKLDPKNIESSEFNSGDDEVRAYFDKAKHDKEQAENDAIEKSYDDTIQQNPQNITAWFDKAHHLKGTNATKVYDEANKACHPNATVWINEARRLGGYSEESYRCLDRAIAFYDAAIKQNPNNATNWNNKGVVFVYQARMDEEAYLGLSSLSDSASISKNSAHAGYREDKWKEALKCFNEAVQLDPKCAAAWYNKGIALYALQDGYESLEYYKAIVECFDQAKSLPDRKDGCLVLADNRDAVYQSFMKVQELQMTSRDVDRVAAYA